MKSNEKFIRHVQINIADELYQVWNMLFFMEFICWIWIFEIAWPICIEQDDFKTSD